MIKRFSAVLLVLLMWTGEARVANADTLIVDSPFDISSCDCTSTIACCSLRKALLKANSGDTVTFRQNLSGFTLLLISGQLNVTKNLIIDGDVNDDQVPDIEINANDNSRVLNIGNNLLVTLDGLIIKDGDLPAVDNGAGIAIGSGGITLIKNCHINSNGDSGENGGGIYNGGTLFLNHSTLNYNDAFTGGAIYNAGTLMLTDSEINQNHAKEYGGGVYNHTGASIDITNTTLFDNRIERFTGDPLAPAGAGIYNLGKLTLNASTLDSNHFQNHTATPGYNNGGGGLYNMGEAMVVNTTIYNNRARQGGGILNNGNLSVVNSTLYNNTANVAGGGIYHSGTSADDYLSIVSSTLHFNSALTHGNGRAIHLAYAAAGLGEHIVNTILSGYSGHICEIVNGALETNGYNLIEDGSCNPVPPLTGDPKLRPFADYGGPGKMLALMRDSPAINAGNNRYMPRITTDQRGTGYPRIEEGQIDIGAYESYDPHLLPIRTKNGKTVVLPF